MDKIQKAVEEILDEEFGYLDSLPPPKHSKKHLKNIKIKNRLIEESKLNKRRLLER